MMSVEKDKLIPGRKIQLVFGIMVALVIVLLAGVAWAVLDIRDLGKENKTRITEIQASRLESCKQTYAGIHKVFLPFFPPKPRTQKQQDDIDKFDLTITTLTEGCEKQVRSSNGR